MNHLLSAQAFTALTQSSSVPSAGLIDRWEVCCCGCCCSASSSLSWAPESKSTSWIQKHRCNRFQEKERGCGRWEKMKKKKTEEVLERADADRLQCVVSADRWSHINTNTQHSCTSSVSALGHSAVECGGCSAQCAQYSAQAVVRATVKGRGLLQWSLHLFSQRYTKAFR